MARISFQLEPAAAGFQQWMVSEGLDAEVARSKRELEVRVLKAPTYVYARVSANNPGNFIHMEFGTGSLIEGSRMKIKAMLPSFAKRFAVGQRVGSLVVVEHEVVQEKNGHYVEINHHVRLEPPPDV